MQAYVVVFQGDNCLVAKKKKEGQRFSGETTAPSLLNYASQWVFPGGKVESGENPTEAAKREFFEETGHRLRWDVYRTVPSNHINGCHILYVESADIHMIARSINENLYRQSTLDDELERVEVVTKATAIELFNNWITLDPVSESVLKRRSKWYRSRDWFIQALQ